MFVFSNQITSEAKGLTIYIFVNEIGMVVMEKRLSVSGDETKLLAQFGISGR